MAPAHKFLLEVPLDASQVSSFNPAYQVKVVAYPIYGVAHERIVNFSPSGQGSALFTFTEAPGSLKLAIWPEAVSTAGLRNLQTISVDVPASSWLKVSAIRLPEITISDYYWNWWLHLTRKFTADRQPIHVDGFPVFGTRIAVYDGDGMW
ncbi:MAG: hypothetical protein ACLPSM_16775 [Acidimicrobiales bacterium]